MHVHLYSTEAFVEAMSRHVRGRRVGDGLYETAWADAPTVQYMAGILPAERYLQDVQDIGWEPA